MFQALKRLFQAPSLEELKRQDLKRAQHALREATLAVESWEAQEILARERISRLERELACPATSKSKAALLGAICGGSGDAAYAALFAGTNGLNSAELKTAFGSNATPAESADHEKKTLSPEASSVRPAFLWRVGKKS